MKDMARQLLLASVLLAVSASGVCADKHALLGKWAVDVANVQSPNPPKSVTLTLAEAAAGGYHIAVEIEASDGSKSRSEGDFKPDGIAVKVTGNQDFDLVSMTMPSQRILVMAGSLGGHPTSTRVWCLSDDGSRMIETAIRYLPDGTPYQRVIGWSRL